MESTQLASGDERAPAEVVMDLVFGRWRSQTLYAGVQLGVFDALDEVSPREAAVVAAELRADEGLLYRLLRALGAIGLTRELHDRLFLLTPAGALLSSGHPASLRDAALLEEGPVHYALWKHLPDMIREGRQNAFVREFGRMAFDHAAADPSYGQVFNAAMSSYSNIQTAWVIQALAEYDFDNVSRVCDIAGGHGHLLSSILEKHTHLRGVVLDLPQTAPDADTWWAARRGVDDRCAYAPGDMFKDVPPADLYMMKMILHDWNDEECVQILSNAARAAAAGARLFVIEHVVPGPEEPHFAKLFDIHMMCWGTGRERTRAEYAALGERAGWKYRTSWSAPGSLIEVLEMRLQRQR
jgi:hypothetical protein